MSLFRQKHATRSLPMRAVALIAVLGFALAACGEAETEPEETADETDEVEEADEAEETEEVGDAEPEGDGPHVVVTTSILGDIVATLVGDDGRVDVIMPPGMDPHGFQPSASDAATMREADLVVANGLNLEESLVSAIDAAEEEGVRVFTFADKLDPIDFDADDVHGHDEDDGHDEEDEHGHDDEDEHGHDDEDEHGHDDEDEHGHGDEDEHGHDDDDGHDDEDEHGHEDEDDHDHGPEDPHVWFDPVRMAEGVQMLAAELADVDTRLDAAEWESRGDDYAAELLELDEEIAEILSAVPDENRQLITNHDSLGYLATRYDFEVLATVIPGSSTQAEADAAGFAELIETVEDAGVSTVFAENIDSTMLADQLASEVIGRSDLEVEVVRIYTGALGEEGSGAETYPGLLRTTATLIADALR